MLKLNMQIDWLSLAYSSAPTKNHSVILVLENEQAEQIVFERKVISPQQNLYELDTLTPFLFHMIVDEDRRILCPFNLKFISKLNPPVVRNIQLNFAELFQHYLTHQLNQDIEPLQQKYVFQEGLISFKVTIQEVQTISDSKEIKEVHKKLQNADSVLSEVKIEVSQLNTEQPISQENSNILNNDQRQSLILSQPQAVQEIPRVRRGKRLKSYHSMAELTISQIAKNVQEQNRKKYIEIQKENEMYKTNHWYLKLGTREGHKDQSESEGLSVKVKILVFLLFIGLGLFVYAMLTDSTAQRPDGHRKQASQRKPKKLRLAKHNFKQPIKKL